ncbi:MAG: AAA family ATPase [Desulfobacterales bacterium]|nr:AAA family ATPase [Desulfobacterales bacterium]
MKSIAIFNNKGGVGKTTLTFHVAYALAELGHKTLLVDLDPQSNLTLFGLTEEQLHHIWTDEDSFIDDFDSARKEYSPKKLSKLTGSCRSVHFLLKPTEDGTGEHEILPAPMELHNNLGLIPGRLTIHMYEDTIASRWSQAFLGDPLAIRTITRIRKLFSDYAQSRGYDYVLVDTSPSLGILNKVIISTADGFVIPCMPDMFSLYGIRNIGMALSKWDRELKTMYSLLSDTKREYLPKNFVQFLGFTIFNAKKYSTRRNPWNLAQAHYHYAQQVPNTIKKFIPRTVFEHLSEQQLTKPVGETSVMHSHSTLPSMAQKYKVPMWKVPDCGKLQASDRGTIAGNRARYEETRAAYHAFAKDILDRINTLG